MISAVSVRISFSVELMRNAKISKPRCNRDVTPSLLTYWRYVPYTFNHRYIYVLKQPTVSWENFLSHRCDMMDDVSTVFLLSPLDLVLAQLKTVVQNEEDFQCSYYVSLPSGYHLIESNLHVIYHHRFNQVQSGRPRGPAPRHPVRGNARHRWSIYNKVICHWRFNSWFFWHEMGIITVIAMVQLFWRDLELRAVQERPTLTWQLLIKIEQLRANLTTLKHTKQVFFCNTRYFFSSKHICNICNV